MYAVLFDNMQQQDAHEFLNYLLNTIGDLLAGMYRSMHCDSYCTHGGRGQETSWQVCIVACTVIVTVLMVGGVRRPHGGRGQETSWWEGSGDLMAGGRGQGCKVKCVSSPAT